MENQLNLSHEEIRAIYSLMDSQEFCSLSEGVYLQTLKSILTDQASWSEQDPQKSIDFSTHPFWLNSGHNYIGFNSIHEALLKGIR